MHSNDHPPSSHKRSCLGIGKRRQTPSATPARRLLSLVLSSLSAWGLLQELPPPSGKGGAKAHDFLLRGEVSTVQYFWLSSPFSPSLSSGARRRSATRSVGALRQLLKSPVLIVPLRRLHYLSSTSSGASEKASYCQGFCRILMLLILALSLALTHSVVFGSISCYDDSGKPVDWFIVYKLPKSHHSSPVKGMRYMYQDGRTQGWVQGRSLMNSTEGAVGRTLNQLYLEAANRQREEEMAYVLYNDEPPKENFSGSKGHTKGVILLDRTQGFWLVHSTPRFPPRRDEKAYAWPHTALTYGQSFLCVTYPYSQFKAIGNQLLFTDPYVYDYQVQGAFARDLPALLNASEGEHVREEPWNSQVTLTSKGGKEFVSFAKFSFFDDDLYSGWLAQALATDLYVEFWLKSHGVLASNCSGQYRVYNVEKLAFQDPATTFFSTSDHSKWCVGIESDSGWTCVGDMNRNHAEEHRGGGTVCFRDVTIWKSFHSLVQNYTDCDTTGYRF